jgi:DNA polymerase V
VQRPVATAETGNLIAAAHRGLDALWREGYCYKKAGVNVAQYGGSRSGAGSSLLEVPAKACMWAIDLLNARYGRDTVTCRDLHTSGLEFAQ